MVIKKTHTISPLGKYFPELDQQEKCDLIVDRLKSNYSIKYRTHTMHMYWRSIKPGTPQNNVTYFQLITLWMKQKQWPIKCGHLATIMRSLSPQPIAGKQNAHLFADTWEKTGGMSTITSLSQNPLSLLN